MGARSATSVFIRIDLQRGALQQQIYAGIRRSILEGVIAPGTRLLSSRALAQDLGVSRTTAILAMEQLLAEGYLATRRGSGTFVAPQLPDELPQVRPAGAPGNPRRHPPLSRRGVALAAMHPAARRIPGPPRAFRLGVPAMDLFPVTTWAQLAGRRLRAVSTVQLDYGEAGGYRVLRQAIADHVSRVRGTRCEAEQVHIVAGAQRGLELLCRMLLDPGDHAIIEEPCYPGIWTALVSAGARILPIRVDDQGIDLEASARRVRKARFAYVTPSHQFPLGVPMSLPRRLALLKWASAAHAWVIEDDYDSEFRYGARPIPCLHGLDADRRVIYVGSFSKTLFPSLRIGFLIMPPDLQDLVLAARNAGAELLPSFLDQAVLADFMTGGHFERHIRRMRAACRERLEALHDAARRLCGGVLRIREVRTGLHAVADLEGVRADEVSARALALGVEVMPVAAYYWSRVRPPQALALGFASVRPDAVNRGMELLARAIERVRRSGATATG